MNELTQLPERWAVERTADTYEKINEYFNSVNPFIYPYYRNCDFVHSQKIELGKSISSEGWTTWYLCIAGFELLTFEQFLQLAYNPWKESQKERADIDKEKLPEFWAVERTNENCDRINEWVNNFYERDGYGDTEGLIVWDAIKGYPYSAFLEGHSYLPKLSNEQFDRLVYSPWKEGQKKTEESGAVLPKRWAVERTEESYKKINEWFNANFPNEGRYALQFGVMHNEDAFDGCWTPKFTFHLMAGFELITYEQFMEWVYNPWKAEVDKVEKSDGWNRCEVSLPKKDGLNQIRPVLVVNDKGVIEIAYYFGRREQYLHIDATDIDDAAKESQFDFDAETGTFWVIEGWYKVSEQIDGKFACIRINNVTKWREVSPSPEDIGKMLIALTK